MGLTIIFVSSIVGNYLIYTITSCTNWNDPRNTIQNDACCSYCEPACEILPRISMNGFFCKICAPSPLKRYLYLRKTSSFHCLEGSQSRTCLEMKVRFDPIDCVYSDDSIYRISSSSFVFASYLFFVGLSTPLLRNDSTCRLSCPELVSSSSYLPWPWPWRVLYFLEESFCPRCMCNTDYRLILIWICTFLLISGSIPFSPSICY